MTPNFITSLGTQIKNITTAILNWMKKISTMNYNNIIKNFIVIMLIIFAIVCFKYCTNIETMRSVNKILTEQREKMYNDEEHSAMMRTEYQPYITRNMLELIYDTNADRCIIEELHNSVKNYAGVGFSKMSMTYEEINENRQIPVMYVANKYKEQQSTLYSLPSYLSKNKILYGSINEIKNIDNRYASNMGEDKQQYVASYALQSNINGKNRLIGWLSISWCDSTKVKDINSIIDKMKKAGNAIQPYLELIREEK